MKYVGAHSTIIEPHLDTCYLGSGSKLPPRKERELCTKEILNVFATREDLITSEIEEIKARNAVKAEDYYNMVTKTFDKHGSKLSEDHKQLISKQHKGISRKEYGEKYSKEGRTPAQRAGDIRAGNKQKGIRNPSKGIPHQGIGNKAFIPWYYVTPNNEYVEVHNITKKDYANKLGFSTRQLTHRFDETNMHKSGKTSKFKGWIFGNLPRPTELNTD